MVRMFASGLGDLGLNFSHYAMRTPPPLIARVEKGKRL